MEHKLEELKAKRDGETAGGRFTRQLPLPPRASGRAALT